MSGRMYTYFTGEFDGKGRHLVIYLRISRGASLLMKGHPSKVSIKKSFITKNITEISSYV